MLCILTLAPHEAAQVAASSFNLSWIIYVLWISFVVQVCHFFLISPRLLSWYHPSFTGKLFWMSVICLAPISLSTIKPGDVLNASMQRYVALVGCQGNFALAVLVAQSAAADWRFPSHAGAIVYGLIGCHAAIGGILFLLEFMVPEK